MITNPLPYRVFIISYICITPQVFHETNSARYEKILLSQDLGKISPAAFTAFSPGVAADKLGVTYAGMGVTGARLS